MLQYQHRFWQYIVLMNQSYLGDFFSHTMAKAGVSVSHWHIYNFNHVILVVKCKFWQQTMNNDQC